MVSDGDHEGAIGALDAAAARVRARLIATAQAKGTPTHLASCLSVVEILVAAGSFVDERAGEIVVLSKGHAALAWYATLIEAGLAPDVDLAATYGPTGGGYAVHPERFALPSIVFSTGALGHGLALGLGWCLGRAVRSMPGGAVVVLGDGETQEGSIWEAASFAADVGAAGLVAVIDANGYGQTSPLAGSTSAEGIAKQFQGCGWQTEAVSGHDVTALEASIRRAAAASGPVAIVARTQKGYGCDELRRNLPRGHYMAVGS